jgi:AraC-like DNA-binding protein
MLTGLSFLIAPLHYLYAKYLVTDIIKFDQKDTIHFIYYVAYLVFLTIYVLSGQAGTVDYSETELPIRFVVFNWILVIQCLSYMVITLLKLYRYSHGIKNVFSNLDKIKLNWLRNITVIFTIGLIIFLFENILYLSGIRFSNFFDFSSAIAALMFYTLGYMGLLKTEVFNEPAVSESIHQLTDLQSQENLVREKYSKSGLSMSNAKIIQEKLLDLMEKDAPYADSNLTLSSLSRKLNVTPHNLSQVFNIHLGQNFFDLINQYRIEKVKKDIINPDKKNLTLLALAFEAGFNSKAAFNIIFKKYTGMTPTEFRKRNV